MWLEWGSRLFVLRPLAALIYAEQIQCEDFQPETGEAISSNQAFQKNLF